MTLYHSNKPMEEVSICQNQEEIHLDSYLMEATLETSESPGRVWHNKSVTFYWFTESKTHYYWDFFSIISHKRVL